MRDTHRIDFASNRQRVRFTHTAWIFSSLLFALACARGAPAYDLNDDLREEPNTNPNTGPTKTASSTTAIHGVLGESIIWAVTAPQVVIMTLRSRPQVQQRAFRRPTECRNRGNAECGKYPCANVESCKLPAGKGTGCQKDQEGNSRNAALRVRSRRCAFSPFRCTTMTSVISCHLDVTPRIECLRPRKQNSTFQPPNLHHLRLPHQTSRIHDPHPGPDGTLIFPSLISSGGSNKSPYFPIPRLYSWYTRCRACRRRSGFALSS